MNVSDQTTGSTPPDSHLRPNSDVMAQRMGDETVLLHLRTNRFYELNRTAARLWELLGAGHDLGQIQEQMLREFDVDAAQLAGEIEDILAAMKDEDLVNTREGD